MIQIGNRSSLILLKESVVNNRSLWIDTGPVHVLILGSKFEWDHLRKEKINSFNSPFFVSLKTLFSFKLITKNFNFKLNIDTLRNDKLFPKNIHGINPNISILIGNKNSI